jgi:hypothetical protein
MSADIISALSKIPDGFWQVFGYVCSTVFGALIGHKVRIFGDARERRRLFCSQVDVCLARLRDTQDGLVTRFQLDTFTTVRDDCAKIRSDVCWLRRRRLDEAARQYYSLPESASDYFRDKKKTHDLLKKIRAYAK